MRDYALGVSWCVALLLSVAMVPSVSPCMAMALSEAMILSALARCAGVFN